LFHIDCRDTNLVQSVLKQADLTGARFQNVDLSGADLTGARFRNTSISPAWSIPNGGRLISGSSALC
jgi:uncharacterized protein YjbI with pentapeptide repeats